MISCNASAGSLLEVFPFASCQAFASFVNIQSALSGSGLANQFLSVLNQVMFELGYFYYWFVQLTGEYRRREVTQVWSCECAICN